MFLILKILGGKDSDSELGNNNILQYNPETEEWQKIGTMKEARQLTAVTVVSYKDYAYWCEKDKMFFY